ncbi:MAG: ATP-grasp fold amidoligase family protein [Candidatus Paceibacteria bacterium]
MEFRKAWRLRIKQLIGLFGPKTAIRLRYFHGFKRFPDLKNPKTFNEKINAYKFMGDRYNFAHFADKVAVKEFVAQKIGVEHVIPTLYAGETLPPRAERNWPLPYVIKMNHGSGWNIMVRTEAERNWDVIEKKIAKWSKQTFGRDTGEVHYSKIKPQVLVEEFIGAADGRSLVDFKFHMIHGQVEFTEVDIDRETNPTYAYYDKDWNPLPFSIDEFTDKVSSLATAPVPKPQHYEEMLRMAEVLSADFPLVRVDFYNQDGHIYFGELTFTPFAGFCYFKPSSFDAYYGAKLHLDSNQTHYASKTNA